MLLRWYAKESRDRLSRSQCHHLWRRHDLFDVLRWNRFHGPHVYRYWYRHSLTASCIFIIRIEFSSDGGGNSQRNHLLPLLFESHYLLRYLIYSWKRSCRKLWHLSIRWRMTALRVVHLYIEEVEKTYIPLSSLSILGRPLCTLRFADDINLLWSSKEEFQQLTERLE